MPRGRRPGHPTFPWLDGAEPPPATSGGRGTGRGRARLRCGLGYAFGAWLTPRSGRYTPRSASAGRPGSRAPMFPGLPVGCSSRWCRLPGSRRLLGSTRPGTTPYPATVPAGTLATGRLTVNVVLFPASLATRMSPPCHLPSLVIPDRSDRCKAPDKIACRYVCPNVLMVLSKETMKAGSRVSRSPGSGRSSRSCSTPNTSEDPGCAIYEHSRDSQGRFVAGRRSRFFFAFATKVMITRDARLTYFVLPPLSSPRSAPPSSRPRHPAAAP